MKSFFLALVTILFSINGYSQTTLDEYTFITKGYKFQIEYGLDMKKGYTLKDYYTSTEDIIPNIEQENIIVSFKALIKTGVTGPRALMMIIDNKDTKNKRYLCIPHIKSSRELWIQAKKDLGAYTGSFDFSLGLIEVISFQFSK